MPIKKIVADRNSHVPVKVWTEDIAENAEQQLLNMSSMKFIYPHIAVMPDVHLGLGATIGSVIPTLKAVVPSAVGVDLGCGMIAQKLILKAHELPDNLWDMKSAIEAVVPHGRTNNGGMRDTGAWRDIPIEVSQAFDKLGRSGLDDVWERHRKMLSLRTNIERHFGTLGTGNHFIEVCLDENDDVWVMLHSGSRGVGNRIGTYFIELAKKDMEKWFVELPDRDLAYFPEGSTHFEDYIKAVEWAQAFAYGSRQVMMSRTLDAIKNTLDREIQLGFEFGDCHHNYISRERHYGKNVIVTRKGAIRAREGDFGIIPGSMGTASYIVEGKGCRESLSSCSHGAGRRMSRNAARKRFTLEDLKTQTEGVFCPKDAARIDEIPGAYKPIEEVMENQADLVKIVHTLKQVINVKG